MGNSFWIQGLQLPLLWIIEFAPSIMAQQHGPAAHWSAQNPIPSIQQFVENLDKDKKERDRRIDEEARQRQEQPEKPDKGKYNARQVTDPVTGRDIEIEDVGEQHMKSVEDPKVRWKREQERRERREISVNEM